MSDDVSGLALICALSTAINSVYAVQKGKNATIPILAGGLEFVVLSIVGGITGRYDLARDIMMLFFIGALITHGIPILNSLNLLVKD